MRVPSTQVQNNFGRYLKYAEANEEIIVTKNGKDIAKISPIHDVLKESQSEYRTSSNGWVTYEEFLELTEASEQRFELIDGVLYNLASPSWQHQHVVHELHGEMYNWFKGKNCTPLTSPFDVIFTKDKDNICVVQPDIIVICDKEHIDDKGKYKGTPSLVVEVLSPSTRSKDLLKKLELYKRCEVQEYWIVDPMHESILIYSFSDQEISNMLSYQKNANQSIQSSCFEGLHIALEQLFAS